MTTPDTPGTLQPSTVRAIGVDVERMRSESAGSLQRFHASMWEYLTGWGPTEVSDAEVAAVVRLLVVTAAEGGELR